jgi:phospholipid/cholesterol/gamma-HCH transport system ATP-binding protein
MTGERSAALGSTDFCRLCLWRLIGWSVARTGGVALIAQNAGTRGAAGSVLVMSDAESILVFEDLHQRWGDLVLYEGLDLELHKGETLALIGRSGTGKSVLLKMALRLLVPDQGSIRAFGEEVTERTERSMFDLRQRIGMMFQNYALFDSLTVLQNISWPLRIAGWEDEAEIRERVAETLEMVNLPGIEDKKPAELSGGMKKRVSLARAMATRPEILLYDGPTTGLDPANAKRVDEIMVRLKEDGVTSILVTHDLRSIELCADRVAMLHDRKICWVGRTETLPSESPQVVRDFLTGNFRKDYDPTRVAAATGRFRAVQG